VSFSYGSLDALLDDEEYIVQDGGGQLIRLHAVQLHSLGHQYIHGHSEIHRQGWRWSAHPPPCCPAPQPRTPVYPWSFRNIKTETLKKYQSLHAVQLHSLGHQYPWSFRNIKTETLKKYQSLHAVQLHSLGHQYILGHSETLIDRNFKKSIKSSMLSSSTA
jgi:hypothetical protein